MDVTGIGAVADLASTVIEKIWPDKTEQEKQQLAAALAIVQGQLAVNQAEAGSTDRFVAGWRPFIGWVCGAACAWNWVGISIAKMIAQVIGIGVALEPANLFEMLPILTGMLGLGAYRTYEKIQGVASK